jgi:hypothetical protein
LSERRCGLEGCDREHYARDLCYAHYRRWQRFGDPKPDVPLAPGRGHAPVEVATHRTRVTPWRYV